MKIDLPADQKKWLESEVAAGHFSSVEEALSVAVSDLRAVGSADLSWMKPYVEAARREAETKILRDMPVSERLRLLEELWASLAEKPDALGVPPWHREDLDARLDAHRRDPATLEWTDVWEDLQRNSRE